MPRFWCLSFDKSIWIKESRNIYFNFTSILILCLAKFFFEAIFFLGYWFLFLLSRYIILSPMVSSDTI